MKIVLSTLGVAAMMALPAFAQSTTMDPMTMKCSDYTAMNSDDMMKATDSVDMAMMSEGKTDAEKQAMMDKQSSMTDQQKTDAMTKSQDTMAQLQTDCTANPDMTVMDAMKAKM